MPTTSQQKLNVAIGALALLLVGSGLACHRGNPDQDMTATVKSRIASDPQLQGQNVHVDTNNGVVTLTGTTTSDDLRTQAEKDATAAGAAKVDNQLTVSATTATAANTPSQAAETQPAPEAAPAPAAVHHRKPKHKTFPAQQTNASNQNNSSSSGTTASTSSENAQNVAATPPAPTTVTLPAGTAIPVRLSQTLSSDTVTAGQTFKGEVSAPVSAGDREVIPAGASVTGTVVSAASSGKIEGRSQLGLRITNISYNGNSYDVSVSDWQQVGPSRGSRSGKVIGGGAGLGALIGAIAHGGKGAVIGAAAGAGAGTAAEVLTKPAQVKLPAETVVTFKTTAPLTVQPSGAVLQQ